MKLPRDRVPYSAIVDRPKLKLPDGGRLIVWTMVNVEEWGIERPMPRTVLPPPMGQPLLPDLPNWAWHEYGMRVGFWRFHECFTSRNITPTLAINGSVCQSYPRVAQAALDAGWEFLGHGYVQGPMHKVEDQRAAIRQTAEAIRKLTGRKMRGWESPGLTETYETIDFLAAEGVEYVADWVLDDQPCEIATASGPIVSIPYTVETNDIAMMALQHHAAEEMLRRSIDQFDRLYEESGAITRVMCVSLHPYISGVPHRIKYVEQLYDYMQRRPDVLFWTGEQVLDWYKAARKEPS
ncbi:MAG TPA: polysaccharide deacetylase family protein [Alphaproteobacteria bacterium]|nr:polysaccharide deacetylase family protein [Alphaproteobacteria bacterium]